MFENNRHRSYWWVDIIACPACGVGCLKSADGDVQGGQCPQCGQIWQKKGNVIEWKAPAGTYRKRSLRNYWNALKFYFDPLASPISPLAILGKARTEKYYERTLSDRTLAENWGRHYLQDLNLPDEAVVLDHGCGRGRNVALMD